MLAEFKQKRVLITGGASGLGKALVEAFARLNWSIWIADINIESANQLKSSLQQSFPDIEIHITHCDVANPDSFAKLSDLIANQWGNLDIIINNAGIASSGLLEETDNAKWERTINTNLNSIFYGCHQLTPLLTTEGPAHIVNIASFAGIASAPGMIAYNVSKAGVIALSESLRVELGHRNIGVSVACPAFFQTNLVNSMTDSNDYVRQQVEKWMASSKISANDVANDIIQGIQRNRFMIISHDYARRIYWLKRLFPDYYLRKLIAKVPKLKQRLTTFQQN